jgi:hypothetical protein
MTASTPRRQRNHRILEVLAVILLGVATIGSAWCGYQATRWNGDENELARRASDLQVEAAREFGLATQVVSYDSNMIAQYARAVSEGDERLQQFFKGSLIRPEFLPTLEQWEQEVADGGSPTNLISDEAYLEEQLGGYRDTAAQAEALTVESEEAGSNADDYVLTTLLLASALFFAGLTTSFRVRFAQLMLLGGSVVLVAYAASRLADLPIA